MAFNRIGYGQVEPNQLSGIKTGQIFASLPLDKEVSVLQNGEFMYYDYNKGTVNGTADAALAPEPYLVYQEIKIYEKWLSYKDFAMIRVGDNYVTNRPIIGNVTSSNTDVTDEKPNGTIYGGGSLTEGADISVTYGDPEKTLNGHVEYGYRMDGIAPRLVKTNVGDIFTTNMVDEEGTYKQGTVLTLKKTNRNTLVLSSDGELDSVKFIVVQVYTMPDGQPGLKIQRIA